MFGALLAGVRQRWLRVHCVTSAVALELSANVLLAVGAVPSVSGEPACPVAGELATERPLGPGSFGPERLDALSRLDEATLIARSVIT